MTGAAAESSDSADSGQCTMPPPGAQPGSGCGGSSGSSSTSETDVAVEDEFDLSEIMGEEVEGAEAVLSKEEKMRLVEEQLEVRHI